MSQEVISQKIRRTCQGCDSKMEFELIGADQATVEKMAGWYSIIREVLDAETGRFMKIAVQACSLECVPAAAIKLALPPQQESEEKIDLASLQVGNQLKN